MAVAASGQSAAAVASGPSGADMSNDVWVLVGLLALLTIVFLINVRLDSAAPRWVVSAL